MPILAIWFAGFITATYAPTTVLTDYWLARTFASMMSFVATPLGQSASRSSFPEVSALYYSIIWWSFPWWLLIWWKWANSQVGVSKTGILFKARLSLLNRFWFLVLVPLWFFLAYAGFRLNHGGDARLVSLGSSRLQLGIFGLGIPAGVAGALVFAFFSIKRAFTSNSGE
jgi:hypothetical protein